jgi:hypothetical protein
MEQVCRIEQLLRLEKTLDITHEATAVWYPDGKIFYFDDCVYEPLEAERGV